MKTLLAIIALSISCHAVDMVITITLSDTDQWAAARQMARGTMMRTNWPLTTVSNYFVFMCRNQIKNFTAMELQQFEWEERAKLSSAHPLIRARIHDLLNISNAPPALVTPPQP